MENNAYKPNHTILLLCEHRKHYQKNILIAWGFVIILTGIVCLFLITKKKSSIDNNLILLSSMSNNKTNEVMPIPRGSSGEDYVKSEAFFPPSGGKVKYNIIKSSTTTFSNVVHRPNEEIETEPNPGVVKDFESNYSSLTYSDKDDFGLPVGSSMIDFYSNKRHLYTPEYNFTKINLSQKSKYACIDWVRPRWPKNGIGVNAVVSILVNVSSKGFKECKIMKEEYPVYGFARALLEAINESIFWPAKDMYGNNLSGSYIITYEFCEECKENTVEILSGDIVIKPRQKL